MNLPPAWSSSIAEWATHFTGCPICHDELRRAGWNGLGGDPLMPELDPARLCADGLLFWRLLGVPRGSA